MFEFDEDSAFRDYCSFRAGLRRFDNAKLSTLTGRDLTNSDNFLVSDKGIVQDSLFKVSFIWCVNTVGREILERLAPGSCIFWPIELKTKSGRSYSRQYWTVETPNVIAAEYSPHEKDIWWGNKVGSSYKHPYHQGWRQMLDLLGPELADWRPVAHWVHKIQFKLSLAEIGQSKFWKSFIWEGEVYYVTEDIAAAFSKVTDSVEFKNTAVVKTKWRPEEQMRPLLEWIEAKPERKREWVRRYPAWVKRHRPEWIKLFEGDLI